MLCARLSELTFASGGSARSTVKSIVERIVQRPIYVHLVDKLETPAMTMTSSGISMRILSRIPIELFNCIVYGTFLGFLNFDSIF